jgi:hypothetical protein
VSGERAEWRALVASFLVVAAVGLLWVGGWAVREATDTDPTRLERLAACLRDEHGLVVTSPADDPLAASAPGGSLMADAAGNVVTVSLWHDSGAAGRTRATYDRLTSQDLADRAFVRGGDVVLWVSPPTAAQASVVYGCTG